MTSDWKYRFDESKGAWIAFAMFIAIFVLYTTKHSSGFTAAVAVTAANKGVLLAIVAMAQTLPSRLPFFA